LDHFGSHARPQLDRDGAIRNEEHTWCRVAVQTLQCGPYVASWLGRSPRWICLQEAVRTDKYAIAPFGEAGIGANASFQHASGLTGAHRTSKDRLVLSRRAETIEQDESSDGVGWIM
jgi:hypothetical protein